MKKRFITLLFALALVFTSAFMSCDTPNNSVDDKGNEVINPDDKDKEDQNDNENPDQNTTEVEIEASIKNDESGIELSWGALPEQVKKVRIYTKAGDDEKDALLFIIKDLSTVKSVKDEWVTKGQEYQYMIKAYDENDALIDKSEWQTITANGGKGELEFNVEAVSTGIHITATREDSDSDIYIYKQEKGSEFEEEIDYFKESSTLDFTDIYVQAQKEYTYSIEEAIYTDALFTYPRYKPKAQTIKATGGSKSILIKAPEISYDAESCTLKVLKLPTFSETPDDWYIYFYYQNEEEDDEELFWIDSYTEINEKMLVDRACPDGEWTLSGLEIEVDFEDYEYYFECKDSALMSGLPQKITIDKDKLISFTATPVTDGIKLEWENLPEEAKNLSIWEYVNNGQREVFDIDNPAAGSVIDKYVTKGVNYKYKIVVRNENGETIDSSSIVSVTATGGLGPIKLNVEATAQGMHITGKRRFTDTSYGINKYYENDDWNSFTLKGSSLDIDFIDPFVKAGEKYGYRLTESSKGDSSGIREFPRCETVYKTATGGSGEVKITNKPSVTYDDKENTITFSAKPELSTSLQPWYIDFGFEDENEDLETLFRLSSNSSTLTSKINDEYFGKYIFNRYTIGFDTDEFSYRYTVWDSNAFEAFPEEITISDEGKLKLTATPVDEGILFEWFNVPEDAEKILIGIINSESENYGEIQLLDKTKSSLLYNYVDPDTEYYAGLEIKTKDDWIFSREICFTPESGLGEPKITNKPVVTWQEDSNYVTFSELPQVPLPSDIAWNIDYIYSLPSEAGRHYEATLFRHYSKDSNKEKALFINDLYGSWTSYAYKIEVRTDSFYYFGYCEDISKIGEIPEEVIISEENAFHLEATQIAQGIKLEWKNIPKNTKTIKISKNWRKGESYSQSFITISDLDDETYYIDENDRITPGQKYEYYPYAYPDLFEIFGGGATITATSGSGE